MNQEFSPSVTSPPASTYGSFWNRLAAYAIDVFMLFIIIILFCLLSALLKPLGGKVLTTILALIALISVFGYFPIFESSTWQSTPGKKVMGLVVTDMNGTRISLLHAIGRYAAKVLTKFTCGIGFLLVLFTPKKQALHDLLAHTLVVKKVL